RRIVSGFAEPQCSAGFFSDSSWFAKSKLPRGIDQLVSTQPLTQRGEVVVARIRDRLRGCEWRQMIFMDARQGEAPSGEATGTDGAGVSINQSGAQCRQRSERFHRRAGHQSFTESNLRIHKG